VQLPALGVDALSRREHALTSGPLTDLDNALKGRGKLSLDTVEGDGSSPSRRTQSTTYRPLPSTLLYEAPRKITTEYAWAYEGRGQQCALGVSVDFRFLASPLNRLEPIEGCIGLSLRSSHCRPLGGVSLYRIPEWVPSANQGLYLHPRLETQGVKIYAVRQDPSPWAHRRVLAANLVPRRSFRVARDPGMTP